MNMFDKVMITKKAAKENGIMQEIRLLADIAKEDEFLIAEAWKIEDEDYIEIMLPVSCIKKFKSSNK